MDLRILFGGHGVVVFRRKFSAVSVFVLKLLFTKFQLVCYVCSIITFDFFMLLRAIGNATPSNPKCALECLMQFGGDVFPTLCFAYRLLLTFGF